jgi:Zn-dependent peptidase ImmA (M78 family)
MADYSFKSDLRISDWVRERLRDFCSSLEGDVVQLARTLGLKVFEESLFPYERGYLQNVPSCGSDSGWVIKINKTDRAETKNFTIAHEIGHFLLHKSRLASLDIFDGRVNRNSQSIADPFTYLEERDHIMESEANGFAAALLMPPNLFKPTHERLGGDLSAVARIFLVSEAAAARRLRELGVEPSSH